MRCILLTIAITAAFTCSAADNRSREICDLQLEGVGSIRLQGNVLSVTDMLAASLGPKDEFESNAAYQQRADKVLQTSPIANGMTCFRLLGQAGRLQRIDGVGRTEIRAGLAGQEGFQRGGAGRRDGRCRGMRG